MSTPVSDSLLGEPSASSSAVASQTAQLLRRTGGVLIVSSVMFTFISCWRTAAVVLCDLASTAYYIGAIVEQSIGPAAPWFILAVMCFSYAVRWVYIESCTMFVRGGVYRVVREAMGGIMARLAVSALLFDYILTGPISSVTAGQYLIGLMLDSLNLLLDAGINPEAGSTKLVKNWGSVALACAVTLYFFYQNLRGIHESSGRALQIMVITTLMGLLLIGWCLLTLAVKGSTNPLPSPEPHLYPRINYSTDPPHLVDPMGFIQNSRLAAQLRGDPVLDEQGIPVKGPDGNILYQQSPTFRWLSLIGFLGIFIAFGHSILAMSGEETLAQVYREVESPKLHNFKKAALIVFLYSICLTATISFLAVLMIPDQQRLPLYAGNLLGGLAMQIWAPTWAKLFMQALVVVVGFLLLSGAVNTALIGSNGVLNRVAEDGVLPDWFLQPHRRYGTTYRILYLITALQLFTILASQGDVFLLGEAYAFGVVWSFVFQALSMMVLRFRRPGPREFMVPGNLLFKGVELPIGLAIILLILLISAVLNVLTKHVATIGGVSFTLAFFTLFTLSQRYHRHKLQGKKHTHVEQFNQHTTEEVTASNLGLTRPYRKLVAIRSTFNLFMLEKALAETDPETTSVVVMTAKYLPPGSGGGPPNLDPPALDPYDQQLMTAVVERVEQAGKDVVPLIVPTNNPLHAILNLARQIQAHEVIVGASNKYTADEQFEQLAFYWISIHGGAPSPLTIRILSRDRDMYLDLAGGNRIPKISERRARSVDELRAAGIGVDRVLMLHEGTTNSSDLFKAVLTMLDDKVSLAVLSLASPSSDSSPEAQTLQADEQQAKQLGRTLQRFHLPEVDGPALVQLAQQEQIDLLILPLPLDFSTSPLRHLHPLAVYLVQHAPCRVFLASPPAIPNIVVDLSTLHSADSP